MALGQTGITTAAVGNAIGSSSRDVGTLCKSTLINKWAYGKPVSYPINVGITARERKLANQGFDLNKVVTISVDELMTGTPSNSWTYVHPSGGTNSPYRLGDFRGYNHNAPAPYIYSFPTNVESASDTCNVSFRIQIPSDAEIKISDLASLENYGSFNTWRYAIAYKLSSWTARSTRFMYGDTVTNAGSEIIIEGTLPTPGTYTIVPVITKETGETSDAMESLALPNGLRTLTFKKNTAWCNVTINTTLNPRYDGVNIYGLGEIMSLTLKSSSTTSVPSTYGELVFLCYCYNNAGDFVGEFTVDPKGTGDLNYSGTSSKSVTLDYLAGGVVQLSDYGIDGSNVSKIVMYADVNRTSGSGAFSMSKIYTWTLTK